MENKRDKLVDALKGYACFLVVFGHVIMGIRKAGIDSPYIGVWAENFIWTFHVQLFMFLSGYVYHITGEWKSKGTRGKFIKHKLLNLGVPYVVFSIIYIVINSMVSSANTDFSLKDILFIWKTPIAQYWFLYALFWLFVIWTLLSKWMSNVMITIALLIIAMMRDVIDLDVGFLGSTVTSALAFGIGTCLNSETINRLKENSNIRNIIVVILHIVTVGILVHIKASNFVIDKAEMLIGIAGSIALIMLITKSRHLNSILLKINKYSLPIYLVHTIFTSAIRIALMKIGIDNYVLHVVLGLFVGFCGPVVMAMIMNKTKYLDFFLYPSRTIKKIKQ